MWRGAWGPEDAVEAGGFGAAEASDSEGGSKLLRPRRLRRSSENFSIRDARLSIVGDGL